MSLSQMGADIRNGQSARWCPTVIEQAGPPDRGANEFADFSGPFSGLQTPPSVFVVEGNAAARPGKPSAPRGNGKEHVVFAGQPPSPQIAVSGLPRETLNNALARYRRSDGYEGYLVEAAWRLEQMGRAAWPALSGLAFACVPECEFFLGAMIRVTGIPLWDRRQALLAAARNTSANTRSRLLELLDELPAELRKDVLHALASPDLPEDDVVERAQEALEVLGAQEI